MKCPFCYEEMQQLHEDLYDCDICRIIVLDEDVTISD
jgi:hypothetical protein